jgi:hypothetical protein
MKTFVLILTLAGVAFALDVGVDSILAPSGMPDSGQSVFPRVVVSNRSDQTATDVSSWLAIEDGTPGGYIDSITHFDLLPLSTETLSYSIWIPRSRDSAIATAWIHCDGDTCPQNDTFRLRFLVRVKDIAITQITIPAPDTIVDSGVVFYPQCRVWNYGNTSLNFDVRFAIGSYRSTRNLDLIAGGATLVSAPDPYTAMPGIWSCIVTAVVPGDMHPENNIVVDTFTVRGTISKDVDARAVLAPAGVVDTTETIIPEARVGNNGDGPATFWAFFIIRDSSGVVVYAESSQVLLGSGAETDVEYPSVKFSVLGNYIAACSVCMAGDQNSTNDVKKVAFRVVDLVQGDIGIVCVEMPRDTVDTFATFYPWVRVKNYGAEGVSGFVVVVFSDTARDRIVYRDSASFRLEGGGEGYLAFDSVRFTVVGNHEGQFWLGTHNHADTTEWPFWVVPFVPGVEEAMNDERGTMSAATVLRGVLWLSEARVETRESRSEVLDVLGRGVLNLKPGANDVSRLAPGVYFVRDEPSAASRQPSAVTVRKVVLQR